MSNMRSDIAATIAIWYNIGPLACGRAVNEFFRIDVSYMGQAIKVSALKGCHT